MMEQAGQGRKKEVATKYSVETSDEVYRSLLDTTAILPAVIAKAMTISKP